jgi:transcriptional regulator with XRE-family HTH domain
MEILNSNIVDRLKNAGLRKKTAAQRLGIDPSYFNKMISGERRWQLEYLEALAKLLNVRMWRFFYDGQEAPTEAGKQPEMVMVPEAENSTTIDLSQYELLPVHEVRLIVEPERAPGERKPIFKIFIKREVLQGMAMGRKPVAVDLGVSVR